MPKSGISLPEECVQKFKDMKKGVDGKKTIRSLWFKIENNSEIVFDREFLKKPDGDEQEEYNSIIAELKENEPRFVLFDMKHGPKDKLFLALWCPDSCTAKERMIMSLSLDEVKTKLDNIATFQWNDFEEATYCNLQKTFTAKFQKYA